MAWVLCSREDVSRYLGLSEDRIDDYFSEWVEGLIEEHVGTSYSDIATTHTDEEYDGDGTDTLMLRHFPVTSVSSLSVDDAAVGTSQYKVYSGGFIRLVHSKDSPILDAMNFPGATFPFGQKNVKVTYIVGQTAIPAHVRFCAVQMIAQIALVHERMGGEGSLALSMASTRQAGDRDRPTWTADLTGKMNTIMRNMLGRKWRYK